MLNESDFEVIQQCSEALLGVCVASADLGAVIAEVKKKIIWARLKAHNGNATTVSVELGINRGTIRNYLGTKRDQFTKITKTTTTKELVDEPEF